MNTPTYPPQPHASAEPDYNRERVNAAIFKAITSHDDEEVKPWADDTIKWFMEETERRKEQRDFFSEVFGWR